MIAVKGKREVLRNLNRSIKNIEGNTAKGMLAAGLFIEGESNENVPHDKGGLIGSSFTSGPAIIAKRIIVRIGYLIGYADIVHEMPETNNFTKPGTGPQFLLKAVTQNARKIIEIIQKRVKF